jgi:sugar/nucleoside kinase (ribokinase family)
MTEIYEKIPRLLKKDLNRMVFFDLADPQKRSPDELKKALLFISKFSAVRQSVLGLNLKEAQQVAAALSLSIVSGDEADLPLVAKNIREKLNLSCVVIHAVAVAASSSATGEYKIIAPYVQHRKVTTGAGDHFNAGFTLGLMLGVSPDAALALGVTFAGFYINTGISPKYSDALAMVRRGW